MRWARFKVDEESKIQMVHHVATWTLLGVMLSNGYWVQRTTVELLGAVDMTDWFYYFYRSIDEPMARTMGQVVFVFVWMFRRVFVFGSGDWGDCARQTLQDAWLNGDIFLMCVAGLGMGLLLMTNYVWTWKIMVSTIRRLRK